MIIDLLISVRTIKIYHLHKVDYIQMVFTNQWCLLNVKYNYVILLILLLLRE